MIAVNLNSKIINPAPATTGAFWNGYDAFHAGVPLENMRTAEHRNGWQHAKACAADTLDLEENMMDRQQWARGTW